MEHNSSYQTQAPMEGPSSQPYFPPTAQQHYGYGPPPLQMPYQSYPPQNSSPVTGPTQQNNSMLSPTSRTDANYLAIPPIPQPNPGTPQGYHPYYAPMVNPNQPPLNVPWSPTNPYQPQFYPGHQPYYPQPPTRGRGHGQRGKRNYNNNGYNSSGNHYQPHQRLSNGRSPRGSPKTTRLPQPAPVSNPDSAEMQPAISPTDAPIAESTPVPSPPAPDPPEPLAEAGSEQDTNAPAPQDVNTYLPSASLDEISLSANSMPSSPQPDEQGIVLEPWCISAFRPDPSEAYALTISPRAKPPSHVVERSFVITATRPSHDSGKEPETGTVASNDADMSEQATLPDETYTNGEVASIPESEPAPAPELHKPLVDGSHSDKPTITSEVADTEVSKSGGNDVSSDAQPDTKPTSTSPRHPPKSWASLLRSEPSSAQGSPSTLPNSLPVSSVVGFSVPANQLMPASIPNSSGILPLLISRSKPKDGVPRINPRGLINLGNMCFANIVLQVLMYTDPFWRLFEELGKLHTAPWKTPNGCVLLDATVRLVREFTAAKTAVSRESTAKASEEDSKEAFVPHYVYDALKTKKRFDSMRGGQQEDAEEFLGFYLDAIEEELLELIRTINPDLVPKSNEVKEKVEDEEPAEEGWTEIGKHNRKVVTRSVKSIDTPISRIFGGKSRSIIRRPGSSESVNVEVWRHLGLDIQSENVNSVEDALKELSVPETVQVTASTRGATIEGSKRQLVDALPPVLVLHIKRFHYDPTLQDVVKQKKTIRITPELTLPRDMLSSSLKMQQPIKYKLYGVLYHHGLYATGGHYTLDVLHPSKTQEAWGKGWREGWIHVDDEHITDTSIQEVIGGRDADDRTPYLLFYRQIG